METMKHKHTWKKEPYEFKVYSVEPIGVYGMERDYRKKYDKEWIKLKICSKCGMAKFV